MSVCGVLCLSVIVATGVEPTEWWRDLRRIKNASESDSDSGSLWHADRPPFKGKRPLTHIGITYESAAAELKVQLNRWFAASKHVVPRSPRGLIVPHARLDLCGDVVASAFVQIDPSIIQKVFLIGPSHHYPFGSPVLSRFSRYETHFGDVTLDQQVYSRLLETGLFHRLPEQDDLLEHSIENVLVFIARTMRHFDFRFVPIVVGNLTTEQAEAAARELADYMAKESSLFIVSTDLCHWGQGYHFTDGDRMCAEETVRRLDDRALDAIATLDPKQFLSWLQLTNHNMCGDTAILLFLHTLKLAASGKHFAPSFGRLEYKVCSPYNDSYVGCASAAVVLD